MGKSITAAAALALGGDWCIGCHYLAAFLECETALDAALHVRRAMAPRRGVSLSA
jgi:hypothetical protein